MSVPRHLVIFHYHLLPGGVTDVIVLAVRAFLKHFPSFQKITLVCGETSNSERVVEKIRQGMTPQNGEKVRCCVEPLLGYVPENFSPNTEKIKKLLLTRYASSESVWLVHNYHLGKNPFFTEALLKIAISGDQKMIFQIHDFPEEARYANMALLQRWVTCPLYPQLPHLRYTVINRRDLEILSFHGLSKQELFLLENPVPPNQVSKNSREKIQEQLQTYQREFPAFRPDAPLVLYPIRAIRRKNVLEAGFLCFLAESRPNFVVTLPGVSATESSYSKEVERSFREGLIPGVFGVGSNSAVSFPDLCGSSDLIISSSVQEGFGYLFFNALLWGKPLVARRVPTMSDFLSSQKSAYLYDEFLVPCPKAQAEELRSTYRHILSERTVSLTEPHRKQLADEIETLGREGTVDYSFLSVSDQTDLLRRSTQDPSLAHRIFELNRQLLSQFDQFLTASPSFPSLSQSIERSYGEAKYAAHFEKIVHSFGNGSCNADRNLDSLSDAFTPLSSLRALLS